MTQEVLGIEANLINLIAYLHTNYKFSLHRNKVEVGQAIATSRMRRGCTDFPSLFVMMINIVIEKITEYRNSFRNDGVYVRVLFFAGDGLLMAHNLKKIESMIEI